MNNTIFITGSTGSIGSNLCKKFLENNYQVVGLDNRVSKFKHHKFKFIKCDLEKFLNNEIYFEKFKKKINVTFYKKSRISLINCAGYQKLKEIDKLKINEIIKHFNINFFSTIKLVLLFQKVIKRNNGYVVNISSIHSKLTKEKFSSYAASKSALSSFTRSLAIELGNKITFLNIEPGAIQSRMLLAGLTKRDYSFLKKSIPTRKVCKPSELAKFIYLIINNEIRYINGSEIDFSGGIRNILKV